MKTSRVFDFSIMATAKILTANFLPDTKSKKERVQEDQDMLYCICNRHFVVYL